MTTRVAAVAALLVMTGCASGTYRLEPGGGVQGLSRLTSDKEQEYSPNVAPDGSVLLFDTRSNKAAAIVSVDPRSGARRTVYTSQNSRAQEPAWDPSGKYFVYSSNSTGVWSLVRSLSNSANSAVSVIVGGEMAPAASTPDVSPDGKRVAFTTWLRDNWNVAVADVNGSNFTLMGEGFDPAWSPDGNRLAFVRRVEDRVHIFTVNSATGADLVQITSGDFDNISPAWSPEGDFIVFSSNRAERKAKGKFDVKKKVEQGQFNLYVVRPDGTGLVQLTDGDGIASQPSWGKDGWIYFTSNQAGNFDIWRLKPPADIRTIR